MDFEFPTVDYIKGLTSSQKSTLQMTGVSKSVDIYPRINILLSTGEQSKVADW
jgi:hypothetical protein